MIICAYQVIHQQSCARVYIRGLAAVTVLPIWLRDGPSRTSLHVSDGFSPDAYRTGAFALIQTTQVTFQIHAALVIHLHIPRKRCELTL